jgi:chromosomal replication initiation ATPase DnaA
VSRVVRPLTDEERASAERILEEVAADHGLPTEVIRARCRRQDIVAARAAAVHRLWMSTDLTLRDIAVIIGVKDHSSVIYLRDLYALRWSAA